MDTATERTHRSSFETRGFTVLSDVVAEAFRWARTVLAAEEAASLVELDEAQRSLCRGRGSARSFVFDRHDTDRLLPDLGTFYGGLLPLLRRTTGLELVLSPFERSAYSIKIYQPDSCSQGWHFDTNSLTALLYLTSNPRGGATVLRGLDDRLHRVQPVAGSLLLMDGVRCEHRAEAVEAEPKVVCLLNYYLPGHGERSRDMDALAFGDPQAD